jgi:hypothetical protein
MILDIAQAVHDDAALKAFPSPNQGTVSVRYVVGAAMEDPGAPFVEWQPTTDKFENYPNMTLLSDGRRALGTRRVGVDLWIHGEYAPGTDDYGSTETLLNAVMYSLLRAAGPSLTIQSGRWLDGTENESGSDRKVYVLSVTFDVPIVEPKTSFSTVSFTLDTQLPVKGGMEFPNGNTVGPSTPPP